MSILPGLENPSRNDDVHTKVCYFPLLQIASTGVHHGSLALHRLSTVMSRFKAKVHSKLAV